MMVFRILFLSFVFSVSLSIACWLVSSFCFVVFLRDRFWRTLLVRHTGLRLSVLGACWCRSLHVFRERPILIKTSFLVLFSLAVVCPNYLYLFSFSIFPRLFVCCVLDQYFFVNFISPLCVLWPSLDFLYSLCTTEVPCFQYFLLLGPHHQQIWGLTVVPIDFCSLLFQLGILKAFWMLLWITLGK